MDNTQDFKMRMSEIAGRAKRVLSFASQAQFDANGQFIADEQERHAQMLEAARKDAIFESAGDTAVSMITSAWGSAIKDYAETYGRMPRQEVLASAHQALETLMMLEASKSKMSGVEKQMLESAGDLMSTQDGVMHQNLFMAMILPGALGAATSDACTFVPVTRDKSDVYEIINVAGNTFGSYQAGEELDMQSVGVYSQLRRTYIVEASADGTATSFTFKIADHEPVACPIRKGRTNIFINRVKSERDNGKNQLLHTYTNKAGTQITVTSTLTYASGEATMVFSAAPDAGTEIAIVVEINIEAAPSLIPTINQEMLSYEMFPSQFVLAAEHSVMAAYDAQREFGLDLGSLQFRTLKDYLAHEQDMRRLRIMIWSCLNTDEFDIAIPSDQTFDVWSAIVKGKLQRVFRNIVERTRTASSFGIFAGADAASFFKLLPPSMFQQSEDTSQAPYVHFIGTLFGNIKVYEVPTGVCDGLTKEGITFSADQCLCYSRDDNPGRAGFVTGDAVPAIPYKHPTSTSLQERTTLWGSAINDMHPRNGTDYFTLLTLTATKSGGINLNTGLINETTSA